MLRCDELALVMPDIRPAVIIEGPTARSYLEPVEAAIRASRDRFCAVLLTSATTVAGLVPLMFETSRQAQMLIPVATSIVFGITASTVLVLVMLPAAYAILGDLGLAAAAPVAEHEPPHDAA